MKSSENVDSGNHTQQVKNLAASCGLYCGSCGIYLATQENDAEKILQYALVLNQSFDETLCDGCKAVRKSVHGSRTCSIKKCTIEKNIEYCGTCREFPCKQLKDFQSRMPHRVEILESQNRLKETGMDQWLIEMKQNYSCPQCKTINTAYDELCRKCGFSPASKFVSRHMELINDHLSNE
jgi:Protein of unknown function (DUF3795)